MSMVTDKSLSLEDAENMPKESKNERVLQYDELASFYEEMASWPFRRDLETPNMRNVIGDVSGLSILDYGCGPGTHVRFFKNAGAARVVGYDANLQMIQYARERSMGFGTENEFISELIPEVHYGQFDIVLGIYVITATSTKDELSKMCSKMGRLLKPGGRLITLPCNPNLSSDPDYYEEYGFRIISQKNFNGSYVHVDGGTLELHACYKKRNIKLKGTYWSEASITQALVDAGFSSVSHIGLSKISPQLVSGNLLKYLNQPHVTLIECKK